MFSFFICVGCTVFLQCICFIFLQNNSVKYLPGSGPVVPQECSDCGKKFNMGGPIWSAPIHDQEWVTSILANVKSMKDRYPAYNRISAILTTISEVCTLKFEINLSDEFLIVKCPCRSNYRLNMSAFRLLEI